jgi:hypothetical protein
MAFGLGVFIILVFLVIVNLGINEFNGLDAAKQVESNIFNFGLSAAIFLIIATAVAMLGFGVYQVASDFKKSSKGLIGFMALIAVFVIAYVTSSGEATGEIGKAVEKVGGISSGNLKFISAGVTTALVMSLAAFGAFIIAEVRNFFK